jgi:hypothetical protein
MTTTESRPVSLVPPGEPLELEFDDFRSPREPVRMPRRRSAFARRLPWAFVVVALAVGYGLGQNSSGNTAAKAVPPQTPAVTPQQINEALSGNGLGLTAINDRGFSKLENGFQHKHTFPLPLTPAQQTLLGHQMNLTREVSMKFPTLASAVAAGMVRAGPFSPGLGLHMIMPADVGFALRTDAITDAQIEHPLAWIYDGTKPTSKVVGLFYMSFASDPNKVQGFSGPNDVWHFHKNICIVGNPAAAFLGGGRSGTSTDFATTLRTRAIDAPLGADRDATQAECSKYGGQLSSVTGPLLHVWTVPGYEDDLGPFAHNNPAVTCNDGSYHEINLSDIGRRLSTCVDGSE